jgi:hypothetical protein
LTLRSGRFSLRERASHHRAPVNGHARERRKSPVLQGFKAKYVKFESNTVVLLFTQVIAQNTSVFAAMFSLFVFKTTLPD